MVAGSPLVTLTTQAPASVNVDMHDNSKGPACEGLDWFCKQRIQIEEEYANRLEELARLAHVRVEKTPKMSSIVQLLSVTESTASARTQLVQQLQEEVNFPLVNFLKEYEEITEARSQQMENSKRLMEEHEDNVVQATKHRDNARARFKELKEREGGALSEEVEEAEDILVTTEEALQQCETVMRDVSAKWRSDSETTSKVTSDLEARQARLLQTSITTFTKAMAHTSAAELKAYQHISSPEISIQNKNSFSHDAVSSAIREVESMLSTPTSQPTRSTKQSTNASAVSAIPPMLEGSRPVSLPVLARPQLSDGTRTSPALSARGNRRSNDSLKENVNKYRPVPNPAFHTGQETPSPKAVKTTKPTKTNKEVQPKGQQRDTKSTTMVNAQELAQVEEQSDNQASHPAPLQTVDSGCFSGNEEGETYAPMRLPPKEEKWIISSRRVPDQRPVQAQNIRELGNPRLKTSYLGPAKGPTMSHVPTMSQAPLPPKEAKQVLATVQAELQRTDSPELNSSQISDIPDIRRIQLSDTMGGNAVPRAQENETTHGAFPQSEMITASNADQPTNKKTTATPAANNKSRISLDFFKKSTHSSAADKETKKLQLKDGTPLLHYVRALWNYDAQVASEISFRANDTLGVIRKQFDGWWEAEITSDPKRKLRGLVPGNYMETI